jgi:hypothetical protein
MYRHLLVRRVLAVSWAEKATPETKAIRVIEETKANEAIKA